MAKGNPNDETMLNNFVAKVWDAKAQDYRPVYIAPDATDKIRGDVYLSDAVDSEDNAVTGVTAASPLAVKTVQESANKKLDKTTGDPQTVVSDVTFGTTTDSGFNGRTVTAGNFVGALKGNADTATNLASPITLTVQNNGNEQTRAVATFGGPDGIKNATIDMPHIDATSLVGTVPLTNLPAASLERMLTVEDATARLALTSDDVQEGDTVYQTDTRTMYLVVDDTKLDSEDGYKEYQAGTAVRLGTEDVGSGTRLMYLNKGTATASIENVGADLNPIYLKNGTITKSVGNVGEANTPIYMKDGTFTAGDYTIDKSVPSTAIFDNFSGATADEDGKAGYVPAPTKSSETNYFLNADGTWKKALALDDASSGGTLPDGIKGQNFQPAEDDKYDLGTVDSKWNNVYANKFVGTLSGDLSLTGNIVDATTVTLGPDDQEIPTAIKDNSLMLAKMGSDVHTVYIGADEPDPAKIGIWVEV